MKRIIFAAALAAATVMAGTATAATTGTKAYPGKNGLIALVRANQIYTISASGTGLKLLTSSGKNYNPVWNPDGTEIAFEHEAPAGVRNVWVMNANGTSKRQWTNTGKTFGSPAWSPDGKTLLLTNGGSYGTLETTSGTKPLQPMTPLSGYNEDQFLSTVMYGNNPAWTTGYIAVSSSNLPGSGNMCYPPAGSSTFGPCIDLYNTATHHFAVPSSVVPVFGDCGIENNVEAVDWPRWAPNGSNLLVSYEVGNCGGGRWHVGTRNNPQPAGRAGDQQADYSPDGRYIVLANALPGQKASIIIESNTGTNRRTLTLGYQPNWQPIP